MKTICKIGKTDCGTGPEGIIFDSIMSIHKDGDVFRFEECCDNWFHHECSKDEALSILDELKNWVLKQ